jgi:uncharacterized delta-60 repeat protein
MLQPAPLVREGDAMTLRAEPLEDRTAPAVGDLDPGFGTAGVAVVPFNLGGTNVDFPAAIAVQPDGKILVAGSANTDPGEPDFAVARLNPDGSLDPTFDGDGRQSIPFNLGGDNRDEALAIALLPDGRILIAGVAGQGQAGSLMAVARLLPDGRPDTSFSGDGRQTISFATLAGGGNFARANALAIQPDGKVIVAGSAQAAFRLPDFAAVRLNPDGSLDATFDGDGRATVDFAGFTPIPGAAVPAGSDVALAVALEPDGQIVLAGQASTLDLITQTTDFAAARLTPSGQLDTTFGAGGRVMFPVAVSVADNDRAVDVAVRPDGRLLLAGPTNQVAGNGGGYALARLNADGSFDLTLNGTGRAFGDTTPATFADADILPDGRVLFGGNQVLRLTAAGVPDPTFGTAGLAPTPFNLDVVAGQPGGHVLAAGLVNNDFAVARFLGATPPTGPALVGGSTDGTARVLAPAGGGYAFGPTLTFFPGFTGTVRTAVADVNADSVPDHIGGAGPGGGPLVAVFDGKTGGVLAAFFAFETTFTGGVFVAAGDVDADGFAEVVVTPDRGGGPVTAVYRGSDLASGRAAEMARFFGIDDPNFRGGARAAVGDVTGDGFGDVTVAAGFQGGPRVTIWDGLSVARAAPAGLRNFFAFEGTLRNGTYVAAGDVTGDGIADLAFGAGPGGGPRVRVFDGRALLALEPFGFLDVAAEAGAGLADFFAGDLTRRGGIRIAFHSPDADPRADLLTGSGEGDPSRVRLYQASTLLAGPTAPDQELDPFGATLAEGVFVG